MIYFNETPALINATYYQEYHLELSLYISYKQALTGTLFTLLVFTQQLLTNKH